MAGPNGDDNKTPPEQQVLYLIAGIVAIIAGAVIAIVQLIVSEDHKLEPVLIAFIGGPMTLVITAKLIGRK